MTLLHSVRYGSGSTTIVFLGSLGSTVDMWLPQLDALSHDATVIALDHRGHGRSPIGTEPGSIKALADASLATLDSLNVESFHLVGLSLGGAVAQYLAAVEPVRVQTVSLLCTAAKFSEPDGWIDRACLAREQGMEALADAIVSRWFSPGFLEAKPATVAHYRDMIESVSDQGYAMCCDALADWDFTAELGRITQPVLTIASADDPATPPETLQIIADGVAHGRAKIVSPGAHVPTIEVPDQINDLLRAHILGVH